MITNNNLSVSVATLLKYGIVKACIIAFILDKGAYTSNVACLARELGHVACFGHASKAITDLIHAGIIKRVIYDGRTCRFSINESSL